MKNVSAAEWARLAGLSNANAIYNLQAGRSEHLSVPVLQKLAKVFEDIDLSTVTGEISSTQRKIRRMTVKMVAVQGVWRDQADAPLDEQYDISVPDNVDGSFAVRVVGQHADEMLPDDSHVIIEEVGRFLGAFYSGIWVLVRRNRGRQVEVTLRTLTSDREGKWWLMARSKSPDQTMPSVPVPWPYEGQVWSVGNERYQIIGVATDAVLSLITRPVHIVR
jgi:hypothetical protein